MYLPYPGHRYSSFGDESSCRDSDIHGDNVFDGVGVGGGDGDGGLPLVMDLMNVLVDGAMV